MRRKMAFIALALFAAGVGYGASLTLIQPNGGELCLGKANYPIQWTAVGVSEKVKLVLFKDGVKVASIAENLEPGSSPYLWKVGQYMGGTAAAGGGYKVRVRTMSNTLDDFSDAFIWLKTSSPPCQDLPHEFTKPRLKVESPNGGESWRLGSDQVISWTGQFMTGKVHLQLYRNGAGVGTIADNLPANGSHVWKAGEILGGMTVAGHYKIRAVAMDNYTVNDMSDQPFTLALSMADVVGPADARIIGKPDLVVCAESAVYTSYGVQGAIHVKVRNIGKGVAKAGFAVRHSLKNVLSSPVVVPVDLLPGGEHPAYIVSLSPYDIGRKIFVFMVDSDQQVAEEDEGNNNLPASFTVTDGPLPANGPLTCSDEAEATLQKLY